MRAIVRTLALVALMVAIATTSIQARQSGKEMTKSGLIVEVVEVKSDEDRKAGVLGWFVIKLTPDADLKVFVRDKTKLQKKVGKTGLQPATFADLEKGFPVDVIYVLRDGQPSMGPALADARKIAVGSAAK
jgi:hypothetical protein